MKYRSIWISDLHLGSKGCSALELLEFLKSTDSENLYLVGDILDFWKMSRKVHWPQSHTEVVRKILKKSKKGTKVIYIPGNHDELIRPYAGTIIGDIEVHKSYVHDCVDGRRLLVIHGDEFDVVTLNHRWLSHVGDVAYEAMIELNRGLNYLRRKTGLGHWSLSKVCKSKVKQAVNFIGNFEESVAKECKIKGYDGVVCGHIHTATIKEIDGVTYYNDGDWVESCTALVEHFDGTFEILNFLE